MKKSGECNLIDDKKSLLSLMQDTNVFSELDSYVRSTNVFDVLKISRTEIRHSNMLAWLLDPNESHGLGDKFLRNIIVELSKKNDEKSDLFIKILLSSLPNVAIYREWNHLDLLLVFHEIKCCIAIENKIGAHEHNANGTDESQLKVYSDKVRKEFPKYDCLYVFLSPDGEAPTEDDWMVFTYYDVLSVLKAVYDENDANISGTSSVLIENYIEIINREVIMDQKLIDLCNEIYRKHRHALDLIFENKQDDLLIVAENCRKWIANHQNPKISELKNSKSKSFVKFQYETPSSILGEKEYYCEFELRNVGDDIIIHANLIVILDGIPQEKKEKIVSLFNISNQSGYRRGLSGVGKTIIKDIGDTESQFEKVFSVLDKKIREFITKWN